MQLNLLDRLLCRHLRQRVLLIFSLRTVRFQRPALLQRIIASNLYRWFSTRVLVYYKVDRQVTISISRRCRFVWEEMLLVFNVYVPANIHTKTWSDVTTDSCCVTYLASPPLVFKTHLLGIPTWHGRISNNSVEGHAIVHQTPWVLISKLQVPNALTLTIAIQTIHTHDPKVL